MSGQRKRRTRSWGGKTRRKVPLMARWSTCMECGKRTFESKKDAKAYRRAAFPGDAGLNAYECTLGGTGYHVGHLPEPVKQGIVSRADIVTNPRVSARHG